MLQEIGDLGFSHAELSHGTRITLVPGILDAIERQVVRIASTHNFCPLPTGVNQSAPNLFEPSSLDAGEHDQWLRQTRRSIDFAAQIGAGAVVCHLGSVPYTWFNPAARVRRFVEKKGAQFQAREPKFHALLASSRKRLQGRAGPYWKRVLASLQEIDVYARSRRVRLGLENREHLEELPFDADFPALFAALGAETAGGYWHDTGHADLKARLGLLDHRAQLEANADQLIGFHLHDVNAAQQDHQPVGEGRIDFAMVSEFWRPHHVLVLELSPHASVEAVYASKQRIEALMQAD